MVHKKVYDIFIHMVRGCVRFGEENEERKFEGSEIPLLKNFWFQKLEM